MSTVNCSQAYPLLSMYPFRYSDRMGTKKVHGPQDEAAVDVLRDEVDRQGVSYRALAARADMSLNRVGIILRKETPPATLGEVDQIAQALGLTLSEVVARASMSQAGYTLAASEADIDSEIEAQQEEP